MTVRSFRKSLSLVASASTIILTLASATIILAALFFKSRHTPADGARLIDQGPHGAAGQTRGTAMRHVPAPPFSFDANLGQFDSGVRFFARADEYDVCLSGSEAVIRLRTSDGAGEGPLRIRFKGANPSPEIKGREPQPGRVNYLIGADARRWRTNVPHFARVEYRDVYPGIGLSLYGNPRRLEYDWVVAPGANPNAIKLEFAGARSLRVEPDGDLIIGVAGGEIRQHKPVTYQQAGGQRREVSAGYSIGPDNEVTYAVGDYDPGQALVIDPVLSYSAFVGASYLADMGTDAAGNVYIFGTTSLPGFPVTAGAYHEARGTSQAELFVAKLNPDGASFAYATYLGGNGYSYPKHMAVDAAGNAYVCAFTAAADMPTTPGAFQRNFAGPGQVGSGLAGDAYLAKLNADGASLGYATYLGGNGQDDPNAVAVDPAGNAYVIGLSFSTDFPTTLGSTPMIPGAGFITKFNPAGSALVYSTFMRYTPGPRLLDRATAIAVDASQNVYLASSDTSGSFVTKLSPGGTSVLYQRALTAVSPLDADFGIAVDNGGQAYVTGKTSNSLAASPGAFQGSYGGGASDAFIVRLNASGGIAFASYLGGSGDDEGKSVAIDAAGNLFVTGWTASANFPVTPGVFQPNPSFTGNRNSDRDAFVTKINASSNALVYSTYLGGDGPDEGRAVAIGNAGQPYVAGISGDPILILDVRFPTTPGALYLPSPVYGGMTNAFIARIDETRTSAADLEMTLHAVGDFYTNAIGSLVFTVRNVGTTPTTGQTKVVYRPPAGLDFQTAVGIGWRCPDGFLQFNNLVCDYAAPLAPGESASFLASFRFGASGSVTNTAKAANGSDVNPANDTATETKEIKQGCVGASFAPGNQLTVGSEGGDYTIQFFAPGGCNWSPAGSSDWIKINSGGGSATGPVSVSIAPNPAAGARTGVIVAAGRSLLVTQGPRVTVTSAASFKGGEMAGGAIAAAFGLALANNFAAATTTPLPTSLAGTTVKIKDSAGVERLAPLFSVLQLQANFQIPPGVADGEAVVTIASGDGMISEGNAQIVRVAPGLFSVDSSGSGYAAGVVLRIREDGSQSYEPVALTGRVVVPIDVGLPSDQVFLILFGTGLRNRSSLANCKVTIGGTDTELLFAGPQGDFVGLDQINLRLPRSLAGRGDVNVVLTADGKTANAVKINVK